MVIKVTRCLGLIISIVGSVVIFGWATEVGVLKSLHPDWVSMKFITAVCFFLCGLMLISLSFGEHKTIQPGMADLTVLISSLGIILCMISILSAIVFNVNMSVEDLFIKDEVDPVMTTAPGRPSIGTLVSFLLSSVPGLFHIFDGIYVGRVMSVVGAIVLTIGTIAVIGYKFNVPALYYYHPNVSTAMALHTAILFQLAGAGYLMLGRERGK